MKLGVAAKRLPGEKIDGPRIDKRSDVEGDPVSMIATARLDPVHAPGFVLNSGPPLMPGSVSAVWTYDGPLESETPSAKYSVIFPGWRFGL
jgi:hypothetical protein